MVELPLEVGDDLARVARDPSVQELVRHLGQTPLVRLHAAASKQPPV